MPGNSPPTQISTHGEFLTVEIAFTNMRWYGLDPDKVIVLTEVRSPDLSKVDEIGFVDLIPGSGHGAVGWSDVAQVDVYAASVPRAGSKR